MGVNLAIELEEHVNGNGRLGALPDAAAPTEDGLESRGAEGDAEATARLAAVIESMLLASGAPVPLVRLVEALDGPPRREVAAALRTLGESYEREGRGLRLVYVAGGYQLRSAPEHGPWVRRLLGGRPPRLSRPMLETLAIIAYRQPCTRPEIEAIRGVDADAVLTTLLERRLIRIQGRKEAPGRPMLYGTTRDFLEVFGLPDLQALPPLAELGEGAEVLMARVDTAGEPTGAAAIAPDGAAAGDGQDG
jgi:segregation and condensation protein B